MSKKRCKKPDAGNSSSDKFRCEKCTLTAKSKDKLCKPAKI
jgi:hypothetical protein